MKNLFALFTLLLLHFPLHLRADLLSATLDYSSGKYPEAHSEFSRLAKLGNKDAIYNIAVMNLHGQGMDKNLVQAHSWFLLAADFGLDDARTAARLIEQNVNDSPALNKDYQTLSADFNYQMFADTLLPVFNVKQYDNRVALPPKRVHSVDAKYPKEAYEKGLEGWVWLEFDVDESGAVKDVDILDAYPDKTFNRAIYNAVRRWRYETFSVDGKVKSYGNRSLLYHFTTFKGKRYKASFSRQKKQYQQKINHLIERAEQGNAVVQYYIANWLVADEHNATKLLRFHWSEDTAGSDLLLASATNGYPNAQYRLGANLLRGEYTNEDRKKGLNWILYAAQGGFVYAQYRLARELLDKRFVEYDPAKAQRWLKAAAEQGHFRAIRDLTELLIEQKDYPGAQNMLDLGLKEDDEHPDLLFSQAKLLAVNGDKVAAKAAVENAIAQAEDRDWYLADLQRYLSGF
ncbi:MAG: TonB family protein [Phenylobacterium sp.]|jgi:TonB family protein